MHIRSTIAPLALAAALCARAHADDLSPPPWRFNPGTTVQHWDFSAGAGGGAPDALPLNNIYGTPMLTTSPPTTWLPTLAGRNDVWGIFGGSLDFDVPNTGVATHQKDLWLQITFLPNAAIPFPTITVGSTAGLFTQIGGPVYTPLANGWVHELTQWHNPICPSTERVSITAGIPGATFFIDQVVIDTQCYPVPTPGAASLISLAGLYAARRRRR